MTIIAKTAVQANVERVCLGLTGLSQAHYAAMGYDFGHDVYGCEWDQGKKFARVHYDMSNGQRMVAFFVDKATGEVWKAAGWKTPAKNFVRGHLATDLDRKAFMAEMQERTSGYFSF